MIIDYLLPIQKVFLFHVIKIVFYVEVFMDKPIFAQCKDDGI